MKITTSLILFCFVCLISSFMNNNNSNKLTCQENEIIKLTTKSSFRKPFDNISIISYAANNPIEDRYKAVKLNNMNAFYIAVLDGHGGYQLSEFANERLDKYIDNFYLEIKATDLHNQLNKTEDDMIKESILKAFYRVEKEYYDFALELYNKGEGRISTVGSCVTIAIITKDKIYTAQLGDSKTVLFRKRYNDYKEIQLTNIFNAQEVDQKEYLIEKFKDEKDIIVCKSPNQRNCYVKGRLQPTKSLGDFNLKYKEFNNPLNDNNINYKKSITNFNGPYIDSVPEIKIFDLTSQDKFIVMGSDGLWDFLNNKEVKEIIKSNESVDNINNCLITNVLNKAAKRKKMTVEDLLNIPNGKKKRSMHDDTTIIIFRLNK